ncbi:MAG: hypothetical protein DRG30_04380 [Epsilonproteobacteria bacterium]|nr:MAG: hypothetical protein DRG30_04380 [Campylobacterota bacterium]
MKNSNNKHSEAEPTITRRIFIKKVGYSAPVLIALGQLAKPISAISDSTGGPEGPPGGFLSAQPATQTQKQKKPLQSNISKKPLQSNISKGVEDRTK